jgi:hypothetical protein
MKDKKTVAISVAIPIVMALAAIAIFVVPWDDLFSPRVEKDPYLQSDEYILSQQKSRIRYITSHGGTRFRDAITLEERRDSEGKPYYIGVLNNELGGMLDELVAAYNADPQTTEPIDIYSARYELTENIRAIINDPMFKTPLGRFILWCERPADLVYKGTVTDGDGTQHRAGEGVFSENISNYSFVHNDGKVFNNFIYRHEYEAGK